MVLANGERLNDKEMTVLRMVSQAMTNEEIGQHMGVSANMAKHHIRSIMDKVGLSRRIELARWYWEKELEEKAAELKKVATDHAIKLARLQAEKEQVR